MELSILSYNIEGLTLEYNYCDDQSLKEYIIEKSKYLNQYLPSLNADIICIQEYTPILTLNFSEYYRVISGYNAIFFKKNIFKYVKHITNDSIGLLVDLDWNGKNISIGTNRLPPFEINKEKRKAMLEEIDLVSKEKLFIYALDTNMKKTEESTLNNLVDCFSNSTISDGYYTLDKQRNPYFRGDNLKKTRTRYDKIFCTNLFDCVNFVVIKPSQNAKLVHELYPYGGISDHYPISAILEVL